MNAWEQYANWVQDLHTFMPDAGYGIKSFATDEKRKAVCAYAVFSATHTGEGGPCPPTENSTSTDYVRHRIRRRPHDTTHDEDGPFVDVHEGPRLGHIERKYASGGGLR